MTVTSRLFPSTRGTSELGIVAVHSELEAPARGAMGMAGRYMESGLRVATT